MKTICGKCAFQCVINRLKHAVYLVINVIIPESQNPIALCRHERRSYAVMVRGLRIGMLMAISLNDQLRLMANEIGNI